MHLVGVHSSAICINASGRHIVLRQLVSRQSRCTHMHCATSRTTKNLIACVFPAAAASAVNTELRELGGLSRFGPTGSSFRFCKASPRSCHLSTSARAVTYIAGLRLFPAVAVSAADFCEFPTSIRRRRPQSLETSARPSQWNLPTSSCVTDCKENKGIRRPHKSCGLGGVDSKRAHM
jgi:hypothetical protein